MSRELIIDSFAGGGGASTGIEMALGRSPDIAINHDDVALAMHAANHPETRHLPHNIWKVDPAEACGGQPVGLLWASPDCFPAGTLVLTEDGYRPIEQLSVGEKVLTHAGRWRGITETSRSYKQLLSLRGHGHPGLVVSHEHPILARRRRDVWCNDPRGYRMVLDPQDWIPASGLDRGWYWAAPTAFPVAEVPDVGGRGFTPDLRLMWLIGRYLGDGWTRLTETRAEIVITCGMHEIGKLRAKLSVWPREGTRCFGPEELVWHERETGTAYQFTSNHRGLVKWLRRHFGHRAESKGLPAWALGIPSTMREALLEGYLSADGWQSPELCEARTVSKALAFSMKALVNSLGKTVTIHRLENSGTIEGRVVNARLIYLLRWRVSPSPAHVQTRREGGMEWCPIRDQIDLGEAADVFNIGVEEDESFIAEGIIVHNCKHFSKAKGGRPVEQGIRDLAWVVVRWARQVRPRIIMLENVEEFATWGPLGADGRPCPDRSGQTFKRWIAELRGFGYQVEHRELCAADYGAPTVRKRLFLIARRDGLPIVWPSPTHAKAPGRLKRWRAAAEIIDWSLPCPSIFDSSEAILARYGVRAIRPLADNTLARIARGVKRYVLDAAQPFIVPYYGDGAGSTDRAHPLDEPLRTQTTENRHALITPFVATMRNAEKPINGADEPTHTVTAGGAGLTLVAPTLINTRNGERAGQEPRCHDAGAPYPTITAKGSQGALVAAFLAQHNTDMVGHDMREPVSTIVQKGCTQAVVSAGMINLRGTSPDQFGPGDINAPVNTISAGGIHAAEVRAFLVKYYGAAIGQDTAAPLHAVTGNARFGLVTVMIGGEPYAIVDIGMRMLTPRELFRAQGFPDDYLIDRTAGGAPITKTNQIRMCGNSVCPPVAAALVAANCSDLGVMREAAE